MRIYNFFNPTVENQVANLEISSGIKKSRLSKAMKTKSITETQTYYGRIFQNNAFYFIDDLNYDLKQDRRRFDVNLWSKRGAVIKMNFR